MNHFGRDRRYKLGFELVPEFRYFNQVFDVCRECGAWRAIEGWWPRFTFSPWLTGHPLEPGERQPLCPGPESALEGDMVPDFNDVWGGAGPDGVRAGYSLAGVI